jgi:hypothetical protein
LAEPGRRYRVTFRVLDTPTPVPAAQRLKQLLKYALRVLRLRALEVVELPGEGEPPCGPTS